MYLFFDTETSGLPVNHRAPIEWLWNWPRLVQVAWLLTRDDGAEVESSEYIIRPEGFSIPTAASRIHGITTERALREGVDLKDVLGVLRTRIKEADILVAHNLQFDQAVVAAEFLRAGYANPLESKAARCTMRESTRYCGLIGHWGGYKWPTLQELHAKLFGEEFGGAHQALVDVRACARCFFELRDRRLVA